MTKKSHPENFSTIDLTIGASPWPTWRRQKHNLLRRLSLVNIPSEPERGITIGIDDEKKILRRLLLCDFPYISTDDEEKTGRVVVRPEGSFQLGRALTIHDLPTQQDRGNTGDHDANYHPDQKMGG